jgi:hypothetical protein
MSDIFEKEDTESAVEERKEEAVVGFAKQIYDAWWDGQVFVTPKVFFNMREVYERARKNYYGVYEEPLDVVTGKEKYWPPLTEHIVETVVKSTDFDSKNFQPYSASPALFGFSKVLRLVLMDKLKRMKWGEKINNIERTVCIDGSCILKAVKVYDSERKKWVMDAAIVDNLNAVADPAADTLDSSPIVERTIMSPLEFRSFEDKWKDLDDAKPIKDISKTDPIAGNAWQKDPTPQFEVWEVWGEMPLIALTGKDEDENKTFHGHAVLTGLGQGKGKNESIVVHLIEESPYKDRPVKKPYKEIRYRKVPNRRPGRGVAEMLFGAQLYLNDIVLIRQNNGQILQNGLFKVRVGSGLSQDLLSQLAAGGAIPVEKMEDIEQLAVQDYRAASYQDEDRVFGWAQRQSFANATLRGEKVPSSQSATNSIIQDKSSRDALELVQEDMSIPLAEFFEQFIIPNLVNEYDDEDIVRITGDVSDLADLDRAYVEHMIAKQLMEYIEKEGSIPPASVVEEEKRQAYDSLRRLGPNRHIKMWKKLLDESYGVEMVITNERIDTSMIIQNLKEILSVNQANPNSSFDNDKIISRSLELMGISASDFAKTYVPPKFPTDKLAPEVSRAIGGAGAPNISKMSGPSMQAGMEATAVAANTPTAIRQLAQ